MTPGEWRTKADYEGGILDAVFGYGLTERDLDEWSGDFYEAVRTLRLLSAEIGRLLAVIESVPMEDNEDW